MGSILVLIGFPPKLAINVVHKKHMTSIIFTESYRCSNISFKIAIIIDDTKTIIQLFNLNGATKVLISEKIIYILLIIT